MICIICGKKPFNETMKEGPIYDWDLDIKGDPQPMCNECHASGDYKGLASLNINSAINDMCFPKLDNKSIRNHELAAQSQARWFLFSDNLHFWADLAEMPMEEIRRKVHHNLDMLKGGYKWVDGCWVAGC
ncbi:hypothetical protein KAR91_52975 [Candidatus Pacearchaeota archaeon]|nr:hypothetical protein [Candidatus Pacearchaeota archaeon]